MKLQLEAMPLRKLTHFQAPDDTPTSIWREAEILRPGTYKGHDFTADDVVSLVQQFDSRTPAPLQLEHNMSLEKYHGDVREVKLVQDDLVPVAVGLVNVLGSWAVERVLDGRFHALSAGLFIDPCYMDELSFVRRGACPTARLLSEEPIMDEDEKKEEETTVPEDATLTEESEDAEEPKDPEKAKEYDRLSNQKKRAEHKLGKLHEALNVAAKTPFSAQESEDVDETERLKLELAEANRKLELADVQATARQLMSEGFTTPALQGEVEKFLLSLPVEARDGFVELMRAHDPVWSKGRVSKVKLAAPPKDNDAQYERMREAAGLK